MAKKKVYETIVVPEGQTWWPTCPHDGGTLKGHDAGGVVCTFCKTRFNVIYEGDED